MKQDLGHRVQQGFNRAMGGQLQLDPVLVLNDPHRRLEQFENNRVGQRAAIHGDSQIIQAGGPGHSVQGPGQAAAALPLPG